MSDWSELKRLAMEATPGPWTAVDYGNSSDAEAWFVDTQNRKADIFQDGDTIDPNHYDSDRGGRDMKFIAAANHQAILALIAENEKLRGALELLKNPLSIMSVSTKCMACGEYHEGLGNLPCPKMRPMSSVDAEQGNG